MKRRERIREQLRQNYEKYSALVDRSRGMTSREFFKEERILLKRGELLRAQLGIHTQGEAILCQICKRIFTNPKLLRKSTKTGQKILDVYVSSCKSHAGMIPADLRE